MSWTSDPEIRNWLPQLQAHRGYWVGGLQQNSLAAIRAAYERGYAMAEFDVRMTREGELILFHDDFFENQPIRKTTLRNLRSQIPVTTLEELFQWFSGVQGFKLNLEIKSKILVGNKMEREIYELIKKYSLKNRVLISSFNPLSLYRMRKLDPGIYRALLLTYKRGEGNNWFVTSMIMNAFCRPHALHLRAEDFSESFREISRQVPLVLWTVNKIEIFDKYEKAIHGIISDEITPEIFKLKS